MSAPTDKTGEWLTVIIAYAMGRFSMLAGITSQPLPDKRSLKNIIEIPQEFADQVKHSTVFIDILK